MKQNIIFLDATQEYPVAFTAANTKVELMGRGLRALGNRVLVINGVIGRTTAQGAGSSGVLAYVSFPQRISKYWGWIFNIHSLFKLLRKHRQRDAKNIIVLGASYYFLFLIYVMLGRWLGYRLVVMFDEWHITGMETKISKKANAVMFDYTFGYFLDGILPISEFLEEKAARFGKKQLRLPVLAEYGVLPGCSPSGRQYGYFLYCAHAGYLRVILVLLDALVKYAATGREETLMLILSGKAEQLNCVRREIELRGLNGRVEVRTKVPFKELHELYQQALALLIPLDPDSIQDQARFSQKIAEYLAAARPIITTDVGEIPYYFTDCEDAVIASSHSSDGYTEAMLRAAADLEEASKIGCRGHALGERTFDYRDHCRKLSSFFETI